MATEQEQRISEIEQMAMRLRAESRAVRNGERNNYLNDHAASGNQLAAMLEDLLEQLASVPSQIEAAVKAEREACAKAAGPQYTTLSPELNSERALIAAAIRSRGETSL